MQDLFRLVWRQHTDNRPSCFEIAKELGTGEEFVTFHRRWSSKHQKGMRFPLETSDCSVRGRASGLHNVKKANYSSFVRERFHIFTDKKKTQLPGASGIRCLD